MLAKRQVLRKMKTKMKIMTMKSLLLLKVTFILLSLRIPKISRQSSTTLTRSTAYPISLTQAR